jgi:hypothetical protein
VSVTVVSCVYGDVFPEFIDRWAAAIHALEPAPDAVIVAADRSYYVPNAETVEAECEWKHPQAFYLQTAIAHAVTDWVWIADIDDIAIPNALRGIDTVDADVWQMGFDRSDGEIYVPPLITNEEYLESRRNVYVGSSAIRTDAFDAVGGLADIALQDWGLWRKLAKNGATIEPSGRVHFRYMLHDNTRSETELTLEQRAAHLAEMMESELAVA